jgi:hypothetical protein
VGCCPAQGRCTDRAVAWGAMGVPPAARARPPRHPAPALPSLQNQFDSIDLSDNAVVRLDGFPKLARLKVLLLNNNRVNKIARNLEGARRQRGGSSALDPCGRAAVRCWPCTRGLSGQRRALWQPWCSGGAGGEW